ncbi:MAG: hypothetical protein ACLQU1_22450 [Bryobacteraceae bacterium]
MVGILSFPPVLNMLSPGQLMNFNYNPVHLVNTCGAFGSINQTRYKVVVEGTDDPSPPHPLSGASTNSGGNLATPAAGRHR